MSDDLARAEQAVTEAEEKLADAQAFADEARKAVEEAQAVRDAAVITRDGPKHPHQDQIDRMTYIRAQADQRAARHGVAVKLRESSPDPDVLDPRSMLDKSMQRNTKRGTTRPKKGA